MRHLSDEILARLVDDRPSDEERKHLEECEVCATVLEDLREQTRALASLPELRPPADEWDELERRLVAEGLVSRASTAAAAPEPTGFFARRESVAGSPSFLRTGWLQTAAALILFLGGTGFGTWLAGQGPTGSRAAIDDEPVSSRLAGTDEISSMEDAAAYVQSAEETYVDALLTYRELLGDADGGSSSTDPASRVAALEALVAASQAAIQQAPADPFFNGVLASAMAERQAAIRQISYASNDTWY